MKSRTEILVPLAAIQAVPIAVIAWYRLHRYAWYRYSAIVIKRHVSFSQIVTMLRLTLMYYTDFISFMENPEKDEQIIIAERMFSPPDEPSLFD